MVLSFIIYCKFNKFSWGSYIKKPIKVVGGKYISIHKNVRIQANSRIEALDTHKKPEIVFKEGVNIEQGFHCISSNSVVISKNVSIAPYCVVVDTSHPLENLGCDDFQGIISENDDTVFIGEGCFIGAHTIIEPGVSLGKNVIVGANSCVRRGSYPSHVLIAGTPAKIIKNL